MLDFTYQSPTRIVFGRGALDKLPENIRAFSKSKVLLHYGSSSVKKTGLLERITSLLTENDIPFVELGGVVPNPRLSLIRRGIALCEAEGCDFVLAVGGGSVIDSAKGIAIGAASPRDVWDYYMDDTLVIKDALPVGSVLTIPAAGSEMSPGSVVTNDDSLMKRSAIGEPVIPRFAVMNPELTFTLPPYQVACGVTDILAHLMERYFTREKNVDLTDRFIEGAVRTILRFGPLTLKNPRDYDARAEIMWCGTLAQNNLLNTGRLGDWGSHKIEHELSGVYDVAHGAGLAIVFPAWMKYVYREEPGKFVQFATRAFGIDMALDDSEAVALELIARLEAFFTSIGMPTRLAEVGIDDSRFREMAEKCMVGRSHVGAFKPLYADDVEAILRLAYTK